MSATGTIFDVLAREGANSPSIPSGGEAGGSAQPSRGSAAPAAPAKSAPAKTGTIFDELAANPDAGLPPPVREPGSFGQFDPASEGHLFSSATNKGLHEGIALAFGLKKPGQNISSTIADLFDNLVEGTKGSYQKIHDAIDKGGDLGIAGQGIGVALTPLEMIAQGIDGTAKMFEDGAKEMWSAKQALIKGRRTPELDQQFGRGVGMVLSAIGQLAMGGEGERALEETAGKATTAMAERASGPGNALVKARKANFFFSKDPGAYLRDEPVKPPVGLTRLGQLENLSRQVDQHIDALHGKVQNALKAADMVRAVQPNGTIRAVPNLIDWASEIENAAEETKREVAKQEGAANRGKIAAAINAVRDDILNEHDIEGKTTGVKPRQAVPSQVNEIKKNLGGRGNYKVITDPDVAEVAAAKDRFVKNAYSRLKNLVNDAVGGPAGQRVNDLNRRYSNAIEFRELLKDQIDKERGTGGMNALRRKLEWGGAFGGLISGHPWAMALGALEALNRLSRSVPGRVIEAKALKNAPIPRATLTAATQAPSAGAATARENGLARQVLGGQ